MILLAEQEEAIRDSIEMVLTEEGYDCHVVGDSESLLRAIHMHDSDLIIADIEIVHSNIDSIISALDCYENHPPAILITLNYERIRDMLTLIKNGISEYLLKPFQFEDLINRIHLILGSHTDKEA